MNILGKAKFDRRSFLKSTGLASVATAAGPFSGLTLHEARAGEAGGSELVASPFGAPRPVRDKDTRLSLLSLPPGFQFSSFGWVGDTMVGGQTTPEDHDGGAVVAVNGTIATYIRNHEQSFGLTHPNSGTTFFNGNPAGDPALGNFDVNGAEAGVASGGCSRAYYDLRRRRWLGAAEPAIGATHNNCAGGFSPFGGGAWITCEEGFGSASAVANDGAEFHGFPLEVPAEGLATGIPLKPMGRFEHEAVAVDPVTGTVLLTEDNFPTHSGVYFFVPDNVADVHANGGYTDANGEVVAGQLYMLAIKGKKNVDFTIVELGAEFEVESVLIPQGDDALQAAGPPISAADLPAAFDGTGASGIAFLNEEGDPQDQRGVARTSSTSSPYAAGFQEGGAIFGRPEGAWFYDGTFFFLDTNAGTADQFGTNTSAVYAFTPDPQAPQNGKLEVIFSGSDLNAANGVDNLTIHPQTGTVFLCEDGSNDVQRLLGVLPNGDSFVFAENNIILTANEIRSTRDATGAERNPIFVDADFADTGPNEPLSFTGAEWAGASFSPDGNTLFVNVQGQGWTFAIEGPFNQILGATDGDTTNDFGRRRGRR